jgi:hypothetical protein
MTDNRSAWVFTELENNGLVWQASSRVLKGLPLFELLNPLGVRLKIISLSFVLVGFEKLICFLLEIIILQASHGEEFGTHMHIQLRCTKEVIDRNCELLEMSLPKGIACASEKVGFSSSEEWIEGRVNDPKKHISIDFLFTKLSSMEGEKSQEGGFDLLELPRK